MLLILCASIFLNRTLSLSGLIELVLCIVHMFEIKGATQYGVCPLSARPYFSFYGGTCSFAPIIFECKKNTVLAFMMRRQYFYFLPLSC